MHICSTNLIDNLFKSDSMIPFAKSSRKLLAVVAAIMMPALASAQATCTRSYVEIFPGVVLVSTSCSNPESNTWWIEMAS